MPFPLIIVRLCVNSLSGLPRLVVRQTLTSCAASFGRKWVRMHSPPTVELCEAARKRGISINRRDTWENRLMNGLLIGAPFIGSAYACFYFWNRPPGWIEISSFLVFYVIAGLSVGVGFHRGFTHQSFRPTPLLKFAMMFAGSLALQGSVVRWVADHRRHHRFTDDSWDTHSPYAYQDRPIRGRLRGLFHAHLGWMFDGTSTSNSVYAPDLLKDPMAAAFHRWYLLLVAATFVLPYLYGLALGGPQAAWGCLLLGGCVRTTIFHHVTWGVNSLGHAFGGQEASERDQSRNNLPIALLTFGEGWHNNHHAVPRLAYNQWQPRQWDLNGVIIRFLGRTGMVSQIVTGERMTEADRGEDAISLAELVAGAERGLAK